MYQPICSVALQAHKKAKGLDSGNHRLQDAANLRPRYYQVELATFLLHHRLSLMQEATALDGSLITKEPSLLNNIVGHCCNLIRWEESIFHYRMSQRHASGGASVTGP